MAAQRKSIFFALALGSLANVTFAQATRDLNPSSQGTTPGVFDAPVQPSKPIPTVQIGIRSALSFSNNLDLASGTKTDNGVLLEASPYVRFFSNTPTAKYKIDYALRNFIVLSPRNEESRRQALNGTWSLSVYDNWLWLDGSAFIANIPAALDRPISADPGGYSKNSTEVRGLQLAPNIKGLLFNSLPYSARYSFGNTDGNFLGAPNTHQLTGTISGLERAGSIWNWSWTGEWQRRQYPGGTNVDRSYAAGSLFLNVNPDLKLIGGLNFEQIQGYTAKNNKDFGYGPFGGFSWRPVENLSIDANISNRYYANVWQVKANYRSGMFAMGFDASKSLQTSIDSTTFLYDGLGLLSPSGNNISPLATSLVQQNLFTSFGIPFSAALITDAEILSKKIAASLGVIGARNSIAASYFRTQRESVGRTTLSSNTIVSSTRGRPISDLPNTQSAVGQYFSQFETSALSVNFQHRLDSRSVLDFSISSTKYGSPSGILNFSTRVNSLSGSYSTKLTPDVTAGFGARRSQQRSKGAVNTEYDESAVFGSIDWRY